MEVAFKGRCWKYPIPSHCYLARDWCSTGTCVPAEIVLWSPPQQAVLVLKLTEIKSGLSISLRIEPNVVYKVEDSQRYFVVVDHDHEKIGLGFQSREESSVFAECVSSASGGMPLQPYRRADGIAQPPPPPTTTAGIIAAAAAAIASSSLSTTSNQNQNQQQQQPQTSSNPQLLSSKISTSVSSTSSYSPNSPSVSPSPVDLPNSVKAIPGTNTNNPTSSSEPPGNASGRTLSAESSSTTNSSTNSDSVIRAQEPEVSVEETRVRATRASFAPKPEKPLTLVISEEDKTEKTSPTTTTNETSENKQPKEIQSQQNKSASAAAVSPAQMQAQEEEQLAVGERKHVNEDSTLPRWKSHKKHIFMLSSAGKPIYSRYGDEQKLAPFVASLMALVSFVADTNDHLRYFVAGRCQVVFLIRGPVYLVAVSGTGESRPAIARQLFHIHAQVASILTASQISKIFAKRPDFDLRGLLVGTDRVVDNLLHHMNHSAAVMLNAIHPLPLPASTRSSIETALLSAACPELLFAVLISGFSLVHLARPRRFTLDPVDLHILMNFVNSSSSFRTNRSWTPLCLPMFDDKGFLHAYICYLTHDLCLVLLSAKVDAFYKLNECKDTISSKLETSGALKAISDASSRPEYRANDVGSPGLLHFLYKVQSSRQMTAPALDVPYNTASEQKRLFRAYQNVKEHVDLIHGMPHKVYYRVSQKETIVAWITRGFELYATFGPLESKSHAIKACNRVIVWTLQQEADLFILNSPMW